MKACATCGRRSIRERCPRCETAYERRRQASQPYRRAYSSPEYRVARKVIRQRSGGRCEAILPGGRRCSERATEAGHRIPLSTARSYAEAVALCRPELLEDVCRAHNPRGPKAR